MRTQALIKNETYLNEEVDPQLLIKQLKLQIKELKEELAMAKGEKLAPKPLTEEVAFIDSINSHSSSQLAGARTLQATSQRVSEQRRSCSARQTSSNNTIKGRKERR